MKSFQTLLLMVCIIALFQYRILYCTNMPEQKFVYITSLYNEKDEERIKEFITCLEQNLKHQSIDTFHIIYDDSDGDVEKSTILNYLISKNLTITYVKGRPTFGFCFDLANKMYPNRAIILSNADIYFNNTLTKLEKYDLTQQFLALTRWQVLNDSSIVPYYNPQNPRVTLYSQDAWIFKTPLPIFEKNDYQLGTPACDSFVAHYARKAGLLVSNPCQTVQCCHLHLTQIRHYPKISVPIPQGYVPTNWTSLTDEYNEKI